MATVTSISGAREARCGAYVLRTQKSVFAINEPIQVEFAGLPPTAYLIDLFKVPEETFEYQSPQGRASGSVQFRGKPAGTYEVRLYVVPYDTTVHCRLQGITVDIR